MTEKEKVYLELEKSFVTYAQMLAVSDLDSNADKESFVIVPKDGSSVVGRTDITRLPSSSPDIMVRKGVMEKLCLVDSELKKNKANYQLVVSYGWRDLAIQKDVFEKNCERLRSKYSSEEELREAVHQFIAAPEVAGHPTGGAVDVLIFDMEQNKYLDFGTDIGDFENRDIIFASPFISKEAKANRKLLRKVMTQQGFASFDGEWWHFSYGDREWAVNFNQNSYLYSQKAKSEIVI